MINFDCPFCSQNLDAPEAMINQDIACPGCSNGITIPLVSGGKAEPVDKDALGKSDSSEIVGIQTEGIQEETRVKSSTVRMEIPSDFGIPKPKPRVFKIMRPED